MAEHNTIAGGGQATERIAIEALHVSSYTIPTDSPESDGTIRWNSTTLVLVELKAGGKTGLGYTYADACVGQFIDRTLRDTILGADAMHIPALTGSLIAAIRNDGQEGLAMMAVSAVDMAAWDLKATLLDLPLAGLLGMVRKDFPLYGSGGFTSYPPDKLQAQLGAWSEAGFRQVKMKIGREPSADLSRIRAARQAIGRDTELFVDANGAYQVTQALEVAGQFRDAGVSWFEEPVPSWDLTGLGRIRARLAAGIRLAAGEYGSGPRYFKKMLSAGAVDVLQADATRCGGISGFLKAGYLAEAFHIPFSSHCAPSAHLHAALSLPAFFTAEYFYDHVRIEHLLFDGIPEPKAGVLYPDLSRPGIGFSLKTADARKYAV